jgi:hypothetical protein
MKAFWDNLFFDIRESGDTNEVFAFKAGNEIRDDLRRVEDAIREYDLIKALTLIHELKNYY